MKWLLFALTGTFWQDFSVPEIPENWRKGTK